MREFENDINNAILKKLIQWREPVRIEHKIYPTDKGEIFDIFLLHTEFGVLEAKKKITPYGTFLSYKFGDIESIYPEVPLYKLQNHIAKRNAEIADQIGIGVPTISIMSNMNSE